jgi:hypothetical protein
VVHHCQRLTFGLEAGDDLFGIHARLDDFESDLAANRFGLFCNIDDTHAPFADLFHQLVWSDDAADGIGDPRHNSYGREIEEGLFQSNRSHAEQ